jgi:FtsH-binding integral membrane protein
MGPGTIELTHSQAEERSLITKVYGWMGFGLLITALVATLTANSPEMIKAIFGTKLFIGLIILELAVVIILSFAINRIPPAVAVVMFVGYAALNGLTLSVIFLAYTMASIAGTFFISAGTFAAMCAWGYFTKRDLSSIGNLCFMALIGLIIASIANMFFMNETVYWATTFIGIGVFVGLTAYHTQKIKRMGGVLPSGSPAARRAAIIGALALYLDFINIFLYMLRLFGRRR